MIISLSGKIGAGKTTAARYLSQRYGYHVLSTRRLLSDILVANGKKVDRRSLQDLGKELVAVIGPSGFVVAMLEYLPKGNYVIDAIRYAKAVDYLRLKYPNRYKHFHISVEESLREKRLRNKQDLLEKTIEKEADKAPTELDNDALRQVADADITNNNSREEFYLAIVHAIKAKKIDDD